MTHRLYCFGIATLLLALSACEELPPAPTTTEAALSAPIPTRAPLELLRPPSVDAHARHLRVERCNGRDDDGDGLVDEDAYDAQPYFLDQDQDGLGDPTSVTWRCAPPYGYVLAAGDPDDTDPSVPVSAPAPIPLETLELVAEGGHDLARLGTHLSAGGDLNDDGHDALVLTQRGAVGLEHVVETQDTRTGGTRTVWLPQTATPWIGRPSVSGDLDGDAFDDLVAGYVADDILHVCVVYGGNRLPREVTPATCDAAVEVGPVGEEADVALFVGDLTGDGAGELVVASPHDDVIATDAGAIYVFSGPLYGHGATPLAARFGATAHAHYGDVVALADLDADHVATLLWQRSCALYTWSPQAGEAPLPYGPDRCVTGITNVGDLDGDRADDLALHVPTDDAEAAHVALYLTTEVYTERFDFPRRLTAGADSDLRAPRVVAGDLDGDHFRDLAILGGRGDTDAVWVLYGPDWRSRPMDGALTIVSDPTQGPIGDVAIRRHRGAPDALYLSTPFESGERDAAGVIRRLDPREGAPQS